MSLARRAGAWLFSQPYLLLTLTSFFWASNFIVARFIAGTVPPIALAQIRWAGAALVVLPFAWPHLKRDWPLIRADWPILAVLAATGIGMFNCFAYLGLQHTTATNGALMQSMAPLLIGLWSFLFFRDRLTALQLAGILVSLGGVALIVSRGELQTLTGLSFNVGDLWLVLAMTVYALYSSILRRSPKIHWLSFVAVTFTAGQFMIVPFTFLEFASGKVVDPTPAALLGMVWIVLFSSIAAYSFFNRGVQLIGALRAGPFFQLIPVFASAMGIAFLGEEFRAYHAIGYGLILAGLALAQQSKSRGAA